jgi:hypothetical protein
MKTSIFCVTHAEDVDWIPYLLRSVHKYCKGFYEVVLAIERGQEGPFMSMGLTKEKIVLYENPDKIDRYMNHMVAKCSADQFCTGDLICYVDSDCVFSRPTSPETYMRDGKPVLLYQSYKSLGSTVPWQSCTEAALGIPVENETMRCHPAVYHRRHLSMFRGYMEKLHGKTVYQYLSKWNRQTPIPNNFSEFNAIGSYLFKWHHNDYSWINSETEPLPNNPLEQFWGFCHRPTEPENLKMMKEYGLA